ncbi:oligosaccharide flippase family protein [Pseudoalteromonas agarivorans]|uniref:oligosaccharide flippase family protein n=1 Tax=Pseudoalteromonas agarivorans TaxID=176102 RepID=UPI00311DDE6C
MNENKSKGIVWLFISKFFPPIINFAVFTYSARILAPEDFGLIAFALSIIYISSSLMPVGWRESIIKFQINDSQTISSIFWLNFFVSILLSFTILVFCLLSPFGFQTEIFNYALAIFCVKLVFDGLYATLNILLLKEQKYKNLALRTFLSGILSASIIILLLTLGYGIWALIWSQVVLSIFNFIVVYTPTRHSIKLTFKWKHIIKLNSFSVYTTLTNGLTFALSHYESLIIGSVLGNRQLGFYSVAKRLSTIMNEIFIGTVSEVSFPILAKTQAENGNLRVGFLNSVYFSVALLYPVFIFLLAYAPDIFVVLFTEKWMDSVPTFQAFCIAYMIVILGIPQKNIILLTNNAKWWFHLQLKLSLIIVPITTACVYWGLNSFLIALIIGKLTYCTASMIRSCKLLNISIKHYLSSFISPVICAVVSIILTVNLGKLLFVFNKIIVNVFLAGLCYIITYFILMYMLDGKKLINNSLSVFPKNKTIIKLANKLNYKEIAE